MKLGGRVLTAVHVFNSPAEVQPFPRSFTILYSFHYSITFQFQVDNEAAPFYGIPDNAKSLLEEPTKVLQLKDLVCSCFIYVCFQVIGYLRVKKI
jgi:splicing factor U2AF 65 kDa subunit